VEEIPATNSSGHEFTSICSTCTSPYQTAVRLLIDRSVAVRMGSMVRYLLVGLRCD
jgi:hypothetical protein